MEQRQNIFPNLPQRISGLGELAENLWWSWNPAGRMLFKMLDRQAWKESGHNPDKMLKEIPVEMTQGPDARQDMEIGELGYWPVGRAFCIFFGPTPVSTGDKPRAYSPVNPLGIVLGDATLFRSVHPSPSPLPQITRQLVPDLDSGPVQDNRPG